MSSIHELKDGTTEINMLQNSEEAQAATNEKFDISTGQELPPSNEAREKFDPTTIMPKKEEEQKPTILENILEGPDSMLAKYIEKRGTEMDERLSTFEEEKAEVEEGLSDKNIEDDGTDHSSLIGLAEESHKPNIGVEDNSIIEDDLSKYSVESDIGFEKEKSLNETSNEKENKTSTVVESPNIDVQVSVIDNNDSANNETTEDDIVAEDAQEMEDEATETLEHLQKIATEKIKPISKKLDISGFTVVKKASMNSNLFKKPLPKAAKWVLMNQESIVLMKEFTGAELQALREATEDYESISSLTRRYKMIYDHIISPKPASLEAWLKATPYADIDHYFFAIYISAYKDANFVPKDCSNSKCKETYLTDNIDIMSMTKFKSEEIKAKFMDIYKNETVYPNSKGIYIAETVPVSENLAIAFRSPSIYSLFENRSLDKTFRAKFEEIIPLISYIDSIYIIDQETKTLIPVGYKGYPENAVKTVKSKIKKYAEYLRTLNSDEFGVVQSYIREISKIEDTGLSYCFPASTCPKCGTETPELAITAEEAVFTRHQLGALVNTSLK